MIKDFSELIPLLAFLVNLGLTAFVFMSDPRAKINRVYLLWGLSVAVWNFGTFFMFRVYPSHGADPAVQQAAMHEALFWARLLSFGVIFLPLGMFHLSLSVANVSIGRFLYFIYAFQILLALSNFTGFFVAKVRDAGYAYYTVGGPGFWVFLIDYSCLCSGIMVILLRKIGSLPTLHRARVKSMIGATGILMFFGTNDILPILGMDRYPGTAINVYPLGSLAAIFYGLLTAHSVLQHQLLDIHITLGRMAAKLVRLSFMLAVCFVLLVMVQAFFPSLMNKSAFFVSMAVFLISSVIASNFFPRLFGSGSDALERRILGDRLEYHDKIRGFIQSLPWYTDTKLLLDDFHTLLVRTVKVRGYYIVLLDETSRKFTLYRSFPEEPGGGLIELERDSPVFQHFHATKEDYVVLSSDYETGKHASLERRAREQLRQFDAEFCYAFYSDEDPVGLLLLGKKVSEEPYTPHDLDLLRSVAKNLSLIMNQIRLKQRVLVAEEMELLGRMSRGMAHDLNNLITPIWTYMQLANEAARLDDPLYELLPTVTRNVETIQTYIKESLFYSNTLKPHLFPGRLDQTVLKAVEVMTPQLQARNITVKCTDLPPSEVEMDAVLIQRMISNLLGNAGDASKDGAEIEVELARLSRTETNRDWFRLKVIDHGMGISRENMPHVFRPYFTTKDRGSTQRGFGLGLAICKKIVLLHGGNLSIASEENKGTTVQVDLPSRKMETGKLNPAMERVGVA